MGKKPSSQLIADWVVQYVHNNEWKPLKTICFDAIKNTASNSTDDFAYDLIESNILHVAELLRDRIAKMKEDGESLTFEIDDEVDPYIKSLKGIKAAEIEKLRKLDSSSFERLCKNILEKLGGTASVVGSVNDGGVDFVCTDLKSITVMSSLPMPAYSKPIVIGQAKRYKEGNYIKEKELRDFVGGASLQVQEMLSSGRKLIFTPCILAFWTSSDFSPEAKIYAKKLGIWFMNGWTMVEYINELGLSYE